MPLATGPAPAPDAGPVASRGPLRERDFRLLWSGQAISAVGDRIYPVAIALRVLEGGGSATDLGIVLGAFEVAFVAFLLAGGVVADRVRRTRLMVAADAVRALAVLGLALAPASVPVVGLAALALVMGAGQAFFIPANSALLPSVLRPEQLQAGNALNSAALRVAAILGPALGGGVIALAGVRGAFLIDAATFGVSMLTLLAIAEPGRVRGQRTSAVRDALEGLRAVRERPWVLAVLVMATLHLMFAVAPVFVLLPVIARARLGGNAAYSLMLVLFGVGALAGTLVATRWRPRRPGLVALLGLLPWTGVLLALADPFARWWVGAWYLVGGFGVELFGILWVTALQREVPSELLARVTSLDYLVSLALMPVGYALAGPAADAFGPTAVLLVGAGVLVASTLAILPVPGVARFATPRRPDPAGVPGRAPAVRT
jgi:DHA3 family tetracycline resistance protein-like MFS transporter